MGLKEIEDSRRIVFLRIFAGEMISAWSKEYLSEKAVEDARIKSKILEPFPEKALVLNNVSGIKEEPEKKKIDIKEIRKNKEENLKKKSDRKSLIHLTNASSRSLPEMFRRKKEVSQKSFDGMGKLNRLLRDRAIQSIECQGPQKNLIIKKRNEVSLSKIVLFQEEIIQVMKYFSQRARVPIVSGMLKAAVDDLIISAVSSQMVGSRFIISRQTAYDLIAFKKLNER